MEQTGSIAYPNALVMDYLLRSKQANPQIRMKAEQYVNVGYQKLLTFQTSQGGFALWGSHDTPNVFLTAWGIQILQDTGKVQDVDERVLQRAKTWLASRQKADGSFPVEFAVHREIWGRMEGDFGITAYVVWSLAEGGDRGPVVKKAMEYLKKNVGAVKDPYLLALAGAAFASHDRNAPETKEVLDRLDAAKEHDAKTKTIAWSTKSPTMVYAHGDSARIETTALAAYALHKGGGSPATINGALTFLVKAKDASGNWQSTQGTILALKALLAASDPTSSAGENATVEVVMNGKPVATVNITPENSDVLQVVDLREYVKTGRNTVTVASKGSANTMYQIVARHWMPFGSVPRPADEPLALTVAYDRTTMAVDDTVTAKVKLELKDSKPTFMVIVDLGIPPGFTPDAAAFEAMKEKRLIDKYTMTGRQITVYLNDLRPGKPVELTYSLKAKFPVKATAPKSVAYEYYTPTRRTETKPVELTVR